MGHTNIFLSDLKLLAFLKTSWISCLFVCAEDNINIIIYLSFPIFNSFKLIVLLTIKVVSIV